MFVEMHFLISNCSYVFVYIFSVMQLEIERRNCGNKIVEDDEECDCGNTEECANDPCCDSITCKLKREAQCASGECCDENCKVTCYILRILFIFFLACRFGFIANIPLKQFCHQISIPFTVRFQFKSLGAICRDAENECDLPEHCPGDSSKCPKDVYKKNGNRCGEVKNALGIVTGKYILFCFEIHSIVDGCLEIRHFSILTPKKMRISTQKN